MKLSDALLNCMYQLVDHDFIEISMAQATDALLEFFSKVEDESLSDVLDEYGVLDRTFDLPDYAIPDAVWLALIKIDPALEAFPFGQWLELAVKETVSKIFLNCDSESNWTSDEILLSFLVNYFYQLCMNQFRRSDAVAGLNYGVRYNFEGESRIAPIEIEESISQFIFNQCEERVKSTFPIWKKHLQNIHLQSKAEEEIADKPFINVIVAPRLPGSFTDQYTVDEDLLYLMFHTHSSNVTFKICKEPSTVFDGQEHFLGKQPHSLVKDLLELSASIYLADIHTQRAQNLERRLSFYIPVRHPEIWSSVHDELAQTISSLGRDKVSITFAGKSERPQPTDSFSVSSDGKRCVSLFSGGLDSTAGAIWLLNEGYTPIFVSQYANNKLAGIQEKLVSQIQNRYLFDLDLGLLEKQESSHLSQKIKDQFRAHGFVLDSSAYMKEEELRRKWLIISGEKEYCLQKTSEKIEVHLRRFPQELTHIRYFVGRSQVKERVYHSLPKPPDSTIPQYLRSFLFLSLATSVALEKGIDTVFIFENGPVALNPQFSEARVNTRTAHPGFLARYSKFIQAAFGVEIKYKNPFLYSTKGEVVKQFKKHEMMDLLPKTTSCWAWSRVPLYAYYQNRVGFSGGHCGTCLPCFLRRVAIESAGLQEESGEYLADIFTSYYEMPTKDILATDDYLQYCLFVLKIAKLSTEKFIEMAPDFSVYKDDVDSEALIEMYKRHAQEVIDVCSRKSEQISDRFSI